MTETWILVALFVGAYLVGSIPVGILVAQAKGIDLTKVGSGNVGATNVNRALGKEWGIATFVIDMLKGLVPALVARNLVHQPVAGWDAQTIWLLVGVIAVVGHAKSIFWGFKGGKGISTSLGACLAASPLVALSAFVVFILILAVTRYMSIASMVSVFTSVLFSLVYPNQSIQIVPIYVILSIAIIFLHRKNIQRLREGTEPKFKFESKKKAEVMP